MQKKLYHFAASWSINLKKEEREREYQFELEGLEQKGSSMVEVEVWQAWTEMDAQTRASSGVCVGSNS